MSQYPYPPPQDPTFDYYRQMSDPRRIFRRASLIMFIVGGLTAAYGIASIAQAFFVPIDDIMAQQRELLPQQGPPPVTPETLRAFAIAISVAMVLFGVVVVGLGFGVRRMSPPAITTGIAVSCIGLACLVLLVLSAIILTVMNPLYGGAMLFMSLMPTIAYVVQVRLLFKAKTLAERSPASVAQQSQMQMWQQQQLQQAYSQQSYDPAGISQPSYGYGYGITQSQPANASQQPSIGVPPQLPPQQYNPAPPGGSDAPPRQE